MNLNLVGIWNWTNIFLNKMDDLKAWLEQYKLDPNCFERADDDDFESTDNGVVSIYAVRNTRNNRIFIRKDFDIAEEDENGNENESESENDSDSNSSEDYCDQPIFQPTDSDRNHTNSIKYFEREVKHLIEVQIKGYPFLRFIGFNYRTEDSSPFIITKKFKGKTLDHLIKHNFETCENPNTTKMIIFYGVAFALNILHSMDIIHRDIKPENIFLNEKNEPFLGDFGFARLIQESPKLTENVGTTFYMAQELFDDNNTAEPSEKIDSYSFAVTILEALTLNLTIKKNSKILVKNNSDNSNDLDITTIRDHIKSGKRYIIPNEFPENYKDLIEVCWSKDQDERLSMEEIMTKMENEELDLPGYDRNEFLNYVNKLKKAKKKQEKINRESFLDSNDESDSDDDDDSPRKEKKKAKKSDSDDDDDSNQPKKKKPKKKSISKFKPTIKRI